MTMGKKTKKGGVTVFTPDEPFKDVFGSTPEVASTVVGSNPTSNNADGEIASKPEVIAGEQGVDPADEGQPEEQPTFNGVFSDSADNFVRGIVGICAAQREKIQSGKQWRQMVQEIIAGIQAIRP